MTTQQEKEIYARSLSHFGVFRQWDKLIEEMAELTQAVLKERYNPTQENKQRVMEEIVDMQIVLNQLLPLLNKKYMKVYKRNKLLRLEQIINQKIDVK